MHMQNLIKFHQFVQKTLSGNEILAITKGHNSVVNLRNLTHNNPKVDLVKFNEFDQIPLICTQDIEQKPNSGNNQGS